MKRKIEEVQHIKLNFLKYLVSNYENQLLKDISEHVIFTGTGRAALRIILEYYTNKKILHNKNTQVLIPYWLCQSVIHTMHGFCTPTITKNDKIKGVMAYHQYGFPQKIDEISDFCDDKDLFLIEDCANVYESYYNGKRLGTFGCGAIFSFSKLFPSLLGGALVTNDDELYEYGKKRIRQCNKNISHLAYGGRLIWELLKDTSLNNFADIFQTMMHVKIDSAFDIEDISLQIINKQLLDGAMKRRKENYKFVLDYFEERPEYFAGLERDGVIPYIVPLLDKEEDLKKMVKRLSEKNVKTDIYHFDVNRNVLNPNFKRCIWVPIHQGINKDQLKMICETIKNI